MDTAKSSDSNELYFAIDFQSLPDDELAERRRLLECPECGQPAFFRRASIDGRAACFGARHKDSCTRASSEFVLDDDGPGEDQGVLQNPGTHIIVELEFGSELQPRVSENENLPPNPNRQGRHVKQSQSEAKMHRRPSGLLRILADYPSFGESDRILEIGGKQFTARDLFVPLLSVTRACSGRFAGYWGMLSDARRDSKGTLWLNSGKLKSMSFCLASEKVPELFERYRITGEEEEKLAGAYILSFGNCLESGQNKLYSVIDNLNDFSLLLVK